MNSFKTLLLHVDALPFSKGRMQLLKQLAADQQANIEMLYAVQPWFMQVPLALEAGGLAADAFAQCQAEIRDAAQAAFERECRAVQLAPLAWKETTEEPVRGFKGLAWAADLVVLSQRDPRSGQTSGVPSDFVASVLVETGKPGLVLPYVAVPASVGRSVLVAWKPTPESARALTAALPFIQRAGSVHLATWEESADASADTAGPALQFLQRHGVAAEVHHGGRADGDLGGLLLSRAADLQADLLVMGCYGHGRAREWALGGVTRTVLQSMTLPVLMVH